MQGHKLKTLFLALSLGAVASAGAQTYGPATGAADNNGSVTQPMYVPAPSDSVTDAPAIPSRTDQTGVIVVVPVVPPSGVDSRADSKCRNVAPNAYWDCVNSYNGGQ